MTKTKSDDFYQLEYERLRNYCKKRGWKVEEKYFTDNFVEYPRHDSPEKIITVNASSKHENRLYCLLHEFGHILTFASKYYKYKYSKKIREFNEEEDTIVKNIHKFELLEEEFEAWERGLLLAKRLKIRIDRKNFDTVKAKYLKTYIEDMWPRIN
jgi:hypothetical protein